MKQVPGALGRPRGIGWRERWEGESEWGTHVNPCLIHVNVWQKPLQYCKVVSLQLIKINGKKSKKKERKNWCFWIVMLEKTLESPLDCKEIQLVHLKGNQSWVFIERTDVEAETPLLWPPDAKSWLIWKDPNVGNDWGQEEKRTIQDEMVGWHHQLNGHGFGWTSGIGDGQGGLVCCGSWVAKSLTWLSDWTELNWTCRPNQDQSYPKVCFPKILPPWKLLNMCLWRGL